MADEKPYSGEDLRDSKFLSLRVGEEIPRFEVKDVRRVVNDSAQNNLSGVNYRYILENTSGELLTISSWVLWKQVSSAIRKADRSKQVVLKLKHLDVGEYDVSVL